MNKLIATIAVVAMALGIMATAASAEHILVPDSGYTEVKDGVPVKASECRDGGGTYVIDPSDNVGQCNNGTGTQPHDLFACAWVWVPENGRSELRKGENHNGQQHRCYRTEGKLVTLS